MKQPLRNTIGQLDYRHKVAVIYVLGLFMEIMDTTIVNVAIPTLAETFGATPSHTEWTVVSYLVSLAVFIPASGWLGDRFGSRRTFLVALWIFVVASGLCGLAGSLNQLIAFRALQGVGGGLLTPVGATMLYRAFPQHERAKAATAVFGASVLAPAIGPVVGGVLVDVASWRWIFFINIPVGILTLTLASMVLREHREDYATTFDFGGFVLSGLMLVGLILSISLGPTYGWTSRLTLGVFLTAVVCGVALVHYERRHPSPMLHLGLLEDRMFRIGNAAGAFLISGYLGVIFLMPLFLQTIHGMSAGLSGLVLLPQSLGALIGSQIAGRRWYGRFGPRPLMVAGALIAGCSGIVLGFLDADAGAWTIASVLFVRGLAIGPVFIALQTAAYASISVVDTGQALAIFNTQRQMSAAFGASIGAAWLTARSSDSHNPDLAAYQEAFVVVSVLLLLGALIASKIRREDAAATMSSASRDDDEDHSLGGQTARSGSPMVD